MSRDPVTEKMDRTFRAAMSKAAKRKHASSNVSEIEFFVVPPAKKGPGQRGYVGVKWVEGGVQFGAIAYPKPSKDKITGHSSYKFRFTK